jgi:hypothetical protein
MEDEEGDKFLTESYKEKSDHTKESKYDKMYSLW